MKNGNLKGLFGGSSGGTKPNRSNFGRQRASCRREWHQRSVPQADEVRDRPGNAIEGGEDPDRRVTGRSDFRLACTLVS